MNATVSAGRILLVEDESVIRECSTRALADAGYHVDAVGDGQSGWEALHARHYDLLITDNQMPGLSGSDLILKLRSAQMTLPVILASGNILPEHLAMGSRDQPLTALPKPFTPNQLLAIVVEVLRLTCSNPAENWASLDASGDSYLHWGLNE